MINLDFYHLYSEEPSQKTNETVPFYIHSILNFSQRNNREKDPKQLNIKIFNENVVNCPNIQYDKYY